VDRLDPPRFAVVGLSMGGIIAMTYAADHAERLTALVINDIGPDVEAGSNRITELVGARPDSFATFEAALPTAARYLQSPLRDPLRTRRNWYSAS
jgi:pimeloyl-ACP methyl ester carboxylesterase